MNAVASPAVGQLWVHWWTGRRYRIRNVSMSGAEVIAVPLERADRPRSHPFDVIPVDRLQRFYRLQDEKGLETTAPQSSVAKATEATA